MRHTREQRARQRYLIYYTGVGLSLIGFPLSFILMVALLRGTEFSESDIFQFLFAVSAFSLSLGTHFSVFFWRIGWSENWLIDLLFYQLSVLLAILSSILWFLMLIIPEGSGELAMGGFILVLTGAYLATIGEYFDYYLQLRKYNKAIELAPQDSGPYFSRGIFYLNSERYFDSLADFNQAIELDPNFAEAYYHRAIGHHYLHDNEAARDDLNQTIEIDPNMVDAYHQRALIYADLEEYEQAISDVETAQKVAPDHPNREGLDKLIEAWQEKINESNSRINEVN